MTLVLVNSFLKNGINPDPIATGRPLIPRLIWQTTERRESTHPKILECMEDLIAMNPDWDHKLFDARERHKFLESVCSDRFMRAFERIQPAYGAARADMFRYVIVYLHGGVYMDIKAGTTRPLACILMPDDQFVISQWDNGPDGQFPGTGIRKELRSIPGGEFEQWFTIAAPGHPILAAVIEQVIENVENYSPFKFGHGAEGVLDVFGPNAYSKVVHRTKNLHPHRKICAWEQGLQATMLKNLDSHTALDKSHYSRVQKAPVTANGLDPIDRFKYWLAEILAWIVYAPKRLNRMRLRRLRARNARLQ